MKSKRNNIHHTCGVFQLFIPYKNLLLLIISKCVVSLVDIHQYVKSGDNVVM